MRIPVQIGLVLASAAIATQGYAGGPDNPFSSDNAVASDTLDDYRGGFITDNGLAVSLGIERIVTINGNVAERSQLELGDLGEPDGAKRGGVTKVRQPRGARQNLIGRHRVMRVSAAERQLDTEQLVVPEAVRGEAVQTQGGGGTQDRGEHDPVPPRARRGSRRFARGRWSRRVGHLSPRRSRVNSPAPGCFTIGSTTPSVVSCVGGLVPGGASSRMP